MKTIHISHTGKFLFLVAQLNSFPFLEPEFPKMEKSKKQELSGVPRGRESAS